MVTRALFCIILVVGGVTGSISAHSSEAGELTLSSMLEQVDPARAHSVRAARSGCDSVDQTRLDERMQFIYNAAYMWSELVIDSGICVFLDRPVRRVLSPEEAQKFIAATESEFDVRSFPRPEEVEHPEAGGVPSHGSDEEFYIDLDREDELGRAADSVNQSDPRYLVTDAGYPYRNIAMVQTGTSYVETGSAIQITPYVYVTAAHVVINSSTGQLKPNIRVYPANRLPNPTAPLSVASVDYDPTYLTTSSNTRLSKDLAFLRVNVARPMPNYPGVFGVSSSIEVPNSTIGSWGDPWQFIRGNWSIPGCPTSWRLWIYTVFGAADAICIPYSEVTVDRIAVGYPDYVGTINNTVIRRPYAHHGFIWGIPQEYALVRPSQYVSPVSGFGLVVSPGNSGGPVFGRVIQRYQHNNIPGYWVTRTWYQLIGIVTNALSSNPGGYMPMALATGRFPYNQSRWASNLDWNPNVFTAYPNPVYATGGVGTWTLTWNTPGYGQIDAWGTNSLAGPIEHFIGTAPSPGSAPQINEVGTVSTIRFFAHGDYTFPLGSLVVRVLPGATQD